MLNKQCAPSNSPVNILSRTLAQDASFDTSTFTPYFAKRPSSFAITRGAQSVRGIKPKRITSFSTMLSFTGADDVSTIRNKGAISSKNDLYIFFMVSVFRVITSQQILKV